MNTKPIENADFGKTADDYLTHRAGFRVSLFERLRDKGIGIPTQAIVDLGTGTGSLARGFAANGSRVTGVDISAPMIEAAQRLDKIENLLLDYVCAGAEDTGLPSSTFDVVSAGQCWHWFDHEKVVAEVRRLLRPGGIFLATYYDWIPLSGNVVRRTEALIEAFNPAWRGGKGNGIHAYIFRQLAEAGFTALESFSYDEDAIYSHEGWRGRIRASAGVAATLDDDAVTRFDKELSDLLQQDFPNDPIMVPHRVFALTGTSPGV